MGPATDQSYLGDQPAVIHNPQSEQFLVVWQGTDHEAGHVVDELDIFGQRVALPMFCDDFESGTSNAWSFVSP